MIEPGLHDFALRCAKAPLIDFLPIPVDVGLAPPPNPPSVVQTKFVGLSFEAAFLEAYSFVAVVREKVVEHGLLPLDDAERIIDFGSGWGRISRMLLNYVGPTSLYALDVDPEMTALVNTTMPGINTMTVSTFPPSALVTSGFDGVLAFSVFSHLAERAHTAWAQEFGRLVRPGGFAAITVLDHTFFDAVRQAQKEMKKPDPSTFAINMSTTFPDVDRATKAFHGGEFQYASVGQDGARENDHYGWAAAPRKFIEETWGVAGFRMREFVPAHILFPQALVILERLASDAGSQTGTRRFRRGRRSRIRPDDPASRQPRRGSASA